MNRGIKDSSAGITANTEADKCQHSRPSRQPKGHPGQYRRIAENAKTIADSTRAIQANGDAIAGAPQPSIAENRSVVEQAVRQR